MRRAVREDLARAPRRPPRAGYSRAAGAVAGDRTEVDHRQRARARQRPALGRQRGAYRSTRPYGRAAASAASGPIAAVHRTESASAPGSLPTPGPVVATYPVIGAAIAAPVPGAWC